MYSFGCVSSFELIKLRGAKLWLNFPPIIYFHFLQPCGHCYSLAKPCPPCSFTTIFQIIIRPIARDSDVFPHRQFKHEFMAFVCTEAVERMWSAKAPSRHLKDGNVSSLFRPRCLVHCCIVVKTLRRQRRRSQSRIKVCVKGRAGVAMSYSK